MSLKLKRELGAFVLQHDFLTVKFAKTRPAFALAERLSAHKRFAVTLPVKSDIQVRQVPIQVGMF